MTSMRNSRKKLDKKKINDYSLDIPTEGFLRISNDY